MSMKEANSMKNLQSYRCKSIGFSLTHVRINREKKKRVKQIQQRFLSQQLFSPRRLRQLSVE